MDSLKLASELTDWQARRLGRDGRRAARGVYVTDAAEPASLANRARAALATAPPGSVVTGVTAYALAGLALPTSQEVEARANVHLLVPKAAGRRPRRPGIVVHLAASMPAPAEFRSLAIPVADPRQCWVDATRFLARAAPWAPGAPLAPIQQGRFNTPDRRAWLASVQLGDVLVRRSHPLTSLDQFASYVQALPSSPGIPLVRAAFGAVRAGADSLPETQIRLAVVEGGFQDPTVNYKVVAGRRTRYLDLCWPEQRIDLEYQGGHHFADPKQAKEDMVRRGELQRAGWTVIEVAASHLDNPSKMFAQLAAAWTW
jgi:hypothetical protein